MTVLADFKTGEKYSIANEALFSGYYIKKTLVEPNINEYRKHHLTRVVEMSIPNVVQTKGLLLDDPVADYTYEINVPVPAAISFIEKVLAEREEFRKDKVHG